MVTYPNSKVKTSYRCLHLKMLTLQAAQTSSILLCKLLSRLFGISTNGK